MPSKPDTPTTTKLHKSKFKSTVNVKGKGKLAYKKCSGYNAANHAIKKAGKSRYM